MQKVNTVETMEGQGATVKRLMPVMALRNFDPFVLMDHFILEKGMGFPTHPHRGFEGITYLFSGSMNHQDNLGNNETIQAGGAQRFTAGSGIEHSEMPSDTEVTEGIQLWINLPQSKKQIAPSYQQVQQHQIKTTQKDGLIRRPLAGKDGVIKLQENIHYDVIEMETNASTQVDNAEGFNQIIYCAKGQISLLNDTLNAGQCLLIQNPQQLNIVAKKASILIVLSGKPIGEPIYQHGPYVD